MPSVPGLMASSWGRINRVVPATGKHPGRPPKPTYGGRYRVNKSGYIALWVSYTGIGRFKVSRLVCEAFHGPAPNRPASDGKSMAMHMDDNPQNNRPENLRWGSCKDNLSQEGSRARVRAAWVLRKQRMTEEKARLAA